MDVYILDQFQQISRGTAQFADSNRQHLYLKFCIIGAMAMAKIFKFTLVPQ